MLRAGRHRPMASGRGDVAMLRDELARRSRTIVRVAHGSGPREVRVEVGMSIALDHAGANGPGGASSIRSRDRWTKRRRGGR